VSPATPGHLHRPGDTPLHHRPRRPQADTRAALAGTHLFGIAIARYIVRIEPLATMNHEELIAASAPAIQRYLIAT
jgi:hypothetical protein